MSFLGAKEHGSAHSDSRVSYYIINVVPVQLQELLG